MKKKFLIICVLVALLVAGYFFCSEKTNSDVGFVHYEVDLQKQDMHLYWRDDSGTLFRSLGNLKRWLDTKGRRLLFTMNGGMFKADNSPQGLFIQEGKTITPLDTTTASGNFYLKPNGLFYVTKDNKAGILPTARFRDEGNIRWATQSGPMLVIEGRMHPAFKRNSANVNIRNGVGILPNGNVLFAMSKNKINFHDFALYFKQRGCRNALYLDGFVSRTYLPEAHWLQTDGDFGVIIGVSTQH